MHTCFCSKNKIILNQRNVFSWYFFTYKPATFYLLSVISRKFVIKPCPLMSISNDDNIVTA